MQGYHNHSNFTLTDASGGEPAKSSYAHSYIEKPLPDPMDDPYLVAPEGTKMRTDPFLPGWSRKGNSNNGAKMYNSTVLSHSEEAAPVELTQRAERLAQQNAYNNFNPISGQERSADGTWAPASDPWAHQKIGLQGSSAPFEAARAEKEAALAAQRARIGQLRKARISNDGLVVSQRSFGSVRDVMQWHVPAPTAVA